MVISFIQFLANLIIAGVFIRLVEAKTADTTFGKALAFAY